MKKSSSSNNSHEKIRALSKSRSSSRVKLEPFLSLLDKNSSKKTSESMRMLKNQLDQLKFENYLKQVKLDQTLEKIRTLQTCLSQEEKQINSRSTLENINEKHEEEQVSTETLSHLKSTIFVKTNHWKQKVSEISELFQKFSIKHDKISLALKKAVRESEIVQKNLEFYKEIVKNESIERKNLFLKKKLIKDSLEKQSNQNLELLEEVLNEKQKKKTDFFALLKKISSESTHKNQEIISKFQIFLKDFQVFHSFFQKFSKTESFIELLNFSLEKLSVLKATCNSLSLRSEELSSEVSEKQELCMKMQKECELLKNPLNLKEIPDLLDFFPIKTAKNEETLIKVFYSFQQISKELFLKTRQVVSNYPDAALDPLIQDVQHYEGHLALQRSNTLTRLTRRRVNKHLTNPEKFQNESISQENQPVLKSFKNLFKDEFLTEFFTSNQIILLFADCEQVRTQSTCRDLSLKEKKDLIFSVYTKALNTLTTNIARSLSRMRSVVCYLKSFPADQVKNSQLLIACHQKLQKPLVPRFFIRSGSDRNVRKSKSPNLLSNSGSAELESLTQTASKKEMREIDKKIRFIKLKFKMLS